MDKTVRGWKPVWIAPILVGVTFATSAPATGVEPQPEDALTQAQLTTAESVWGADSEMAQVTSVSQLADVQPTDWAFQSLRSLVERYGCIAGYPDLSFKGDRALTRYEFAAGVNACLDRVNELIAAGTTSLATQADLATVQKLREEFAAELAILRGRVDGLEARTGTLEKQQFSTTTKLSGEVIFAITDILTGDDNQTRVNRATTDTTPNQNAVFANRVRLDLNTSFNGNDLLKVRLQSGNFNLPGFTIAGDSNFSSPEGIQTFNVTNSIPNSTACCISSGFQPFANGSVSLGSLLYRFPVGSATKVVIAANGGEHADYTPTLNPYFEDFDGGRGTLSTFGQRSPIYRMGSGFGSGIGMTTQLNKILSVSLGYLANGTGNLPTDGSGLLNGSFSALAQLTVTPSDRFSLGLTYNYTYLTKRVNTNFGEVTGTKLSTANTFVPEDTYNNSFGVAATFRLSPGMVVNGWVTTTNGRDFTVPRGDSDYYYTWSYALGLALPDLGKKGSLGGILVGIEPYLTGFYLNGSAVSFQRSLPFHIEGFYRYQMTENLSITPGFIWLTAPNQDSHNPDIVIGTVRMSFTF
ncbi:MAG: iron uptake porin [Scytolyngbya sp. HA4215-MV1]|nr:iron uptake porin [Scytolyngbya sp. HA4215-MV1]